MAVAMQRISSQTDGFQLRILVQIVSSQGANLIRTEIEIGQFRTVDDAPEERWNGPKTIALQVDRDQRMAGLVEEVFGQFSQMI